MEWLTVQNKSIYTSYFSCLQFHLDTVHSLSSGGSCTPFLAPRDILQIKSLVEICLCVCVCVYHSNIQYHLLLASVPRFQLLQHDVVYNTGNGFPSKIDFSTDCVHALLKEVERLPGLTYTLGMRLRGMCNHSLTFAPVDGHLLMQQWFSIMGVKGDDHPACYTHLLSLGPPLEEDIWLLPHLVHLAINCERHLSEGLKQVTQNPSSFQVF